MRINSKVYKTYFNKIRSKTSVKLRIEDLDLGSNVIKFTRFFEITKKSGLILIDESEMVL